MQFDRTKLKTVILYTCLKCDPSKLGAVKLHKVLYFADMIHYANVGAPITGATYRKRPFGPTCDELLPTLRDLAGEGSLEIREAIYFGYRKKEYIPKRTIELDRLSDVERLILDEVIEFVCANTAKAISELSHNRAWEMADFGDPLPYHTSLYLFPTEVSEEAFDWAASEVTDIEAQRQRGKRLESRSLGDFRNRILQARRA